MDFDTDSNNEYPSESSGDYRDEFISTPAWCAVCQETFYITTVVPVETAVIEQDEKMDVETVGIGVCSCNEQRCIAICDDSVIGIGATRVVGE